VNPNLWKRAKQQRLFAELQGFWREDVWDMRNSPGKAGLIPVARQRYLYFKCKFQPSITSSSTPAGRSSRKRLENHSNVDFRWD
jgi:hypothetical protein